MPSKTFNNLSEKKREQFVEVSLKEFSSNNFDTASLNKIIKELNISRGSVYQYFDHKIDLWLYLKDYAENKKMEYVSSIDRTNFKSFWDYFRELYIKGADFDFENPTCSMLLYRIWQKETSKDVQHLINDWKENSNKKFLEWIQVEQIQGSFNSEISLELIAHFIQTISNSLLDLLHTKYKVNFDDELKANKGMLSDNVKNYTETVEEMISLLSKALK